MKLSNVRFGYRSGKMVIRLLLFINIISLAAEVNVADCCALDRVEPDMRTGKNSSVIIPASNIVEVGLQIMSTLEQSINARCAMFIFDMRGPLQKDMLRKKCSNSLKKACLNGNILLSEIENAFGVASVMQTEVISSSNLAEIVAMYLVFDEKKARNYALDMTLWNTAPPTCIDKTTDYKMLMTEKEKYCHMVLCGYFKGVLMQKFVSYLTQNVKIENMTSAEMRMNVNEVRFNEVAVSEKEIEFVLSVVTNQAGTACSCATALP